MNYNFTQEEEEKKRKKVKKGILQLRKKLK